MRTTDLSELVYLGVVSGRSDNIVIVLVVDDGESA